MVLVRAFGLIIDSAFDLPGAVAVEGVEAEVVIVEGAAMLEGAVATSGPYAAAGDRLLFSAEGVARYLCIGGSRMVVEPVHPRDNEHIAALLIATALPALLWMRGAYVLHAAAFVLPGAGRAIAVTAPSGGGKSTLLAEALRRGARMVADDVLAVDGPTLGPSRKREGSGLPSGSGLCGGYFLPDGSITRRFVATDESRLAHGTDISTLVVLDRSSDGATGITRLSGPDAIAALLAARHRPKVPALIVDPGAHLAQTALLARQVAIYRLTVGKAEPAETFDLVLQEYMK